MPATKRMSQEEKRKAILDIYHTTKEIYTEKEIIALAAKAGVNQNVIADVNSSLVDDGLVDKEKIGSSNYFWSFPGKRDRMLQIEHEKTLEEMDALKEKVTEAEAKLADAKRGREDDEGERANKLQKLKDLATEKKAMMEELESLKENDPQALADLEKELKLVTEAANRWTDNIFSCKSFLTKKKGMSSKEACKLIGISSEFDYPEDKIAKGR